MKLPNILTLIRFLLIIPIIIFFYVPEYYSLTLILLVISWLTDILDGIVAKKLNQQTKIGAFLDPTVDKLLVLFLFIVLADLNLVPVWIALLIVGRDFLVQAIRNIAKSKNKILKSEWSGKLKFGLQMLTFVTAAYVLTFDLNKIYIYWVSIITLAESYYALLEFLWKNQTFLNMLK